MQPTCTEAPSGGPDLEDVPTQLTQEILTMKREVNANQPQQAQQVDVSEESLLKLPAETRFTVPCTGAQLPRSATLWCNE